uniref:Uncharacterized protein n=1 Tax=Arundo donax TaxID=35708 RepID=A0A0A8Y0X9_ARUDO
MSSALSAAGYTGHISFSRTMSNTSSPAPASPSTTSPPVRIPPPLVH